MASAANPAHPASTFVHDIGQNRVCIDNDAVKQGAC